MQELSYVAKFQPHCDQDVHLFVGSAGDPGRHEVRDHVLCYKAKDENPVDDVSLEDVRSIDEYITWSGHIDVVTMEFKEHVSCQECLELIHS